MRKCLVAATSKPLGKLCALIARGLCARLRHFCACASFFNNVASVRLDVGKRTVLAVAARAIGRHKVLTEVCIGQRGFLSAVGQAGSEALDEQAPAAIPSMKVRMSAYFMGPFIGAMISRSKCTKRKAPLPGGQQRSFLCFAATA